MTKLSRLLVAVLALSGLAGGCALGRHGHVAWIAPPVYAATVVAPRPGYVWVDGHWDWLDNRWSWSRGYWVPQRPGFVWQQGAWVAERDHFGWQPGHWREARTQVRDHRR